MPQPFAAFAHASVRSHRISVIVGMGIASLAVVVDQATKAWALDSLVPGRYQPLFGAYFGLRLVYNPGAAFSFGANATWVFTLLAIAFALGAIYALTKVTSRLWVITIGFLLGGSVGNLIDRLFRTPGKGQGHVVDFLSYSDWFVGNVADIFIVLAGAGLAVLSFTGIPTDPAAAHIGAADEDAADAETATTETAPLRRTSD